MRRSWLAALLVSLALGGVPAAHGEEPAPPEETDLLAAAAPRRTGRDVGRMPKVNPKKLSQMMQVYERQPPMGMLGPYLLTRESSGTSWQPESSPGEALQYRTGAWTTMVHAWATAVWDDQRGPRGDTDFFSSNMAMVRTHGPYGPGTLGFRAMLSAEPGSIGREGYPLLLQTGESADGVTPLVDRQHPHDMVMELATSISIAPYDDSSIFLYAGLPGEPALGPPVYFHRFSGHSFPEAPIGHQWLDATHVSYGVLTMGFVDGPWNMESSLFRGREPDPDRTDIETGELDSHSFRLSLASSEHLVLQASYGRLHSPDALEPDVNVDRTTVSAMINGAGRGRTIQTTIAWGRNNRNPGRALDAILLETTAVSAGRHLWMMRLEQVEKDDLYPPGHPRAGQAFRVEKLSGSYRYDLWPRGPIAVGIGGLGSFSRVPEEMETDYGGDPFSGMLYLRAALR